MEEGRQEMRRDRDHGELPGGDDRVVGGGCWSRERLVADGETNQGRNCSSQMVQSCCLRGHCCISIDDQTSGKAIMIFK